MWLAVRCVIAVSLYTSSTSWYHSVALASFIDVTTQAIAGNTGQGITAMYRRSMGKSELTVIPSAITAQGTKKMERVYLDLSEKIDVEVRSGSQHCIIMRDDYTQYTWFYSMRKKSDSSITFEEFLRQFGNHGELDFVHTNNGDEATYEADKDVCGCHRIKRELIISNIP